MLPIFSLFLLFCALLLLNQSLAIREKLSLWPVIPLSFIMRFFALRLTHLMPGSVRDEALDRRDFRGLGCTGSSELQSGECCRCKSKSKTICTLSSMKYHPACCSPSLLQLAEGIYMSLCDPTPSEFSSHSHFRVLLSQLFFHPCPPMQACANQF